MTRTATRERGFTLLEVLVALAVLAVAMGAVIKSAAQGAANATYLRDQTLAGWVALNTINEALLQKDWPPVGDSEGVTEMAEREWQWKLRVANTSDPDLRRLDVSVNGIGEGTPHVSLSAFRGRPI